MPSRSIRIVQSRQNARVKELRAAFARPGKSESGLVAMEGEHLIAEALRSGLRLITVFFRTGSERLLERVTLLDEDVVELPGEVFDSAVLTEAPQGIAALVEAPEFRLEDVLAGANPLVVIAAGLQDPGNLGTLIRSAEAFGASGVIALPGTVSVWNAKALRASSGSAFRLPVVFIREAEMFAALRERDVRVWATVPSEGLSIVEADFSRGSALLIGNEGSGLSAALLAQADGRVAIPCPGPVESLNAAVAASVVLYEAARQRLGAVRR